MKLHLLLFVTCASAWPVTLERAGPAKPSIAKGGSGAVGSPQGTEIGPPVGSESPRSQQGRRRQTSSAQGFSPRQSSPVEGSFPSGAGSFQDSSAEAFPPEDGDGDFRATEDDTLTGETVDAEPTPAASTPIWGNRPVAKHFDSVTFCKNFMISSETAITSYATMKLRLFDNYDVMRCLVTSELLALPHNLIQDVRWSITQTRRQSDPLAAAGQVVSLPFVMARTVAALPVRVFAEFYNLSRRFFASQHEVTRQYVKK